MTEQKRLCANCGESMTDTTRARCEKCLASMRASTQRLRARRREAGLCRDCGIRRLVTGTRCYPCSARHNDRTKANRWKKALSDGPSTTVSVSVVLPREIVDHLDVMAAALGSQPRSRVARDLIISALQIGTEKHPEGR